MFSAIQILLTAVVLVLTILTVVIGVQVWGLIKQLRELVDQLKQSGQTEDIITWLARKESSKKMEPESTDLKEENFTPPVPAPTSWRSSSRSFYRRGRSLS
jgi:predicted PurR-regulated permease PerM